jgi:hypothetical protein
MSDESEVDRVLARVGELRKYLGKPCAVIVLMFALWIVRKKPTLWIMVVRSVVMAAGLGSYGYWNGQQIH